MEFDYVVVGAGSAGSAVASRLSEDRGVTVALLDAGERKYIDISKLPAAVLKTIGNRSFDWNFESEPDPSREGVRELWPRGKTLGGSSAINGMIFVRGFPEDYDLWAERGASGWKWSDVLPYFRRMEDSVVEENEFRGLAGPQTVSRLRYVHPLTPKFIATAQAAGIPFSDDLNGREPAGVGYVQGSIRAGRRQSAYAAYIEPNLKRTNLTVLDAVQVQRVEFDGRKATGVAGRRREQDIRVRARRGVVLCAGALGSPHILMRSGIGPEDDLQRCGIPVVVARKAVGRNLMEHPGMHFPIEVTVPTMNREAQAWRAPFHLMRWVLHGNGPVSVPSSQALAFFRSQEDLTRPDLQLQFNCYARTFPKGGSTKSLKLENRNLITMALNLSYPESRGHLELRSANAGTPLAIHPNLLGAESDIRRLVAGMNWVRRILGTQPLASNIVRTLNIPEPRGYDADAEFVRRESHPFFHPAGTCRMGIDAEAVVTPSLAVRGCEALWVADASVFPTQISGNINATAIMIGDRAADLITTSARRT
ncbi:GMC family oxidoreductase [Paraburkholderia sp. MM5477-R1]|uniref:GMC family oxidoreductase n=1 Tax=Paraburkholderia sp. MM5477-R1 TaxID=2991062 RepID=UPI003D262D45